MYFLQSKRYGFRIGFFKKKKIVRVKKYYFYTVNFKLTFKDDEKKST